MKLTTTIAGCIIAAGLGALAGFTENAYAANETFNVGFNANTFTSAFGQLVPVDPVAGSFQITIDPTQTYQDVATGTANLFTGALNFAGPLVFTYSPTGVAGDSDPGELVIGGASDGAARILLTNPAQDDFILQIPNFFSTHDFQQFLYSQSATPGENLYFTTGGLNESGGVSVERVASGVPEPRTWVMMLAGFACLGYAALRRRQRLYPRASDYPDFMTMGS